MIQVFVSLLISLFVCYRLRRLQTKPRLKFSEYGSKFGHTILIDDIRRHLPSASDVDLRRAVFKYSEPCLLVGNSEILDLRTLAPHLENITTNIDSAPSETARHHTMRSGSGHTFVFNRHGRLITAWGPRLSLHPLDPKKYPTFFVNIHHSPHSVVDMSVDVHVQDPSKDIDSHQPRDSLQNTVISPANTAIRQSDSGSTIELDSLSSCMQGRLHYLELQLHTDRSLCERYGGDEETKVALRAIVQKTNEVFEANTCVRLLLRFITPCDDFIPDDFGPPPGLQNCSTLTNCSRPLLILDHYRRKDTEYLRQFERRDAAYLFTGYSDDTPVVGAAFIEAPCSERFAYGWVERAHPAVLAHEIGHTLGMSHVSSGAMSALLDLSQLPRFSEQSVFQLTTFLDTDWRSWCLDRVQTQSYSWQPSHILNSIPFFRSQEVADLTYGVSLNDSQPALIALLFRQRSAKCSLSFTISESTRELEVGNDSGMKWKKPVFVVDAARNCRAGAGIATAALVCNGASDIVVSYFRPDMTPFLQVLYRNLCSNGLSFGMSAQQRIPTPPLRNVRGSGIAIGAVRRKGSNDLIFVYLQRRGGVVSGAYVVGYGLDEHGNATGGWSDEISLPLWFGFDVGGVSIELIDLTGTGKQDLVVYHSDLTFGEYRSFTHVGRDIGPDGSIRGGWSNSLGSPTSNILRGEWLISAGIAVRATKTDTITAVMETEKLRNIREDWKDFNGLNYSLAQLHFASDVFSRAVYAGTAPYEIQNPTSECEPCYSGHNIFKCENQLQKCFAGLAKVPSLATDALGQDGELMSRMGANSQSQWLPDEPDTDSIFCHGYHSLFIDERTLNCRVGIAEEEIMAAGATRLIVKYLKDDNRVEESLPNDISSSYKLRVPKGRAHIGEYDPGGVNGHLRRPTASVSIISSKKEARASILRMALKMLNQRDDFKRVYSAGRIQSSNQLKNGKFRYVVVFNFDEKYRKELLYELL